MVPVRLQRQRTGSREAARAWRRAAALPGATGTHAPRAKPGWPGSAGCAHHVFLLFYHGSCATDWTGRRLIAAGTGAMAGARAAQPASAGGAHHRDAGHRARRDWCCALVLAAPALGKPILSAQS